MLPVVISCLLIGAHFLRTGSAILSVVGVVVPLIILVPRRWAARFMQIYLVIAALEWIRALFVYINLYEEIGHPWFRLSIILGSVIVFTACSIFSFQTKRAKALYR